MRGQYQITKANKLIQTAAFSLTSLEYDLLNFIIMKIKPEDTELKPQEIQIQEFCRVAGISDKDNYTLIKNSLKNLADKSVWAVVEENASGKKTEQLVRWIEDPRIEPGKVIVQLKKYWCPYLLDLKERYTTLLIQETFPMKSIYGKRIYEILKSYIICNASTHAKTVTFEIDELKRILFGEKEYRKKYQDVSNFRKRVLEPAMKDLSMYGDLNVSYRLRKDGYSYRYIDFTVLVRNLDERIEVWEKEKSHFTVSKKRNDI